MGRVGGSWVGGLQIISAFTLLSNVEIINVKGTGLRSASARLGILTAGTEQTGFFWIVFFWLHKSHIPDCTEEAGRRRNYLHGIYSYRVFPISSWAKPVKIKGLGGGEGNLLLAFYKLVEHKGKNLLQTDIQAMPTHRVVSSRCS